MCSSQKPEQQLDHTHRIGSFSPLALSDRMSDISTSQRTSNRDHTQQPHDQPGWGRLLRLNPRGFRLGPHLLVGDERLGKRSRGGPHETFTALDQPRGPRHFTCAIRVRIKHVTGRQEISHHGEWKPKRPFFRKCSFSATQNKARAPGILQASRATNTMRRHLLLGGFHVTVRPHHLSPESISLAATSSVELTTRTDMHHCLRRDQLSAFHQIRLTPPKARSKSHLPPPRHFTASHPRPSSQKSHQSADNDYAQKAISRAGLAPTPKLQLAPISTKS